MLHRHFDYQTRLKQYSTVIYDWVVVNNFAVFDFDNCMYTPERKQLINQHLTATAENHQVMLVVEQHPFFDTDEKYIETKNELLEIAAQLNLELYFLTADYGHWDTVSTRECFYPHWYFELRTYAKNFNYQNFNWPTNRTYNFSCNNMSNYRSEKIYNYIECFRRNRSDWVLSIYDHDHAQISKFDIRDVGKIREDQMVIWNEQIKDTIQFYKYDLYGQEPQNAMNVLFPGHVDSYCNLVMEHSMEIEILSEKSFKPFVAKQIPVYLAQVGACEALTKLGFDLFYDFVDHNQYDNIGLGIKNRFRESWPARINKVHQLIDHMYNSTNFLDFINLPDTKTRLQKNHDYFYNEIIDHMCINKFNQLLNNQ